jgi:transposase
MIWRYGIAIELFGLGASIRGISSVLGMHRKTVRQKIKEYCDHGFESLVKKYSKNSIREKSKIKTKRVLEIFHQKPKMFGINRSNWNQESVANVYEKKYGERMGISTVGHLIRNAGYKMKKAKQFLTSPDPNYREKVELLLKTIQSLNSDEMFFFLDELGPLRVKKYGGRCYIKKGEVLRVPKVQTLKGSITLFGALSATTNQLSWNYGKSKDTSAMIDLIEILYN